MLQANNQKILHHTRKSKNTHPQPTWYGEEYIQPHKIFRNFNFPITYILSSNNKRRKLSHLSPHYNIYSSHSSMVSRHDDDDENGRMNSLTSILIPFNGWRGEFRT